MLTTPIYARLPYGCLFSFPVVKKRQWYLITDFQRPYGYNSSIIIRYSFIWIWVYLSFVTNFYRAKRVAWPCSQLPIRTKPTTNSFLTAVESRYLGSSLGWQLDFRELQQIMQKSGNFLHPPMKTESFCTLWQPAPACSALKLRTSILYTRSYFHTSVC